jgi:anti-anti-sigma regulatory factor
VKLSTGIFFPGIDYIRENIGKFLEKTDFKYSVVIDLMKVSTIDFTSLQGFKALARDLNKYNLNLSFVNVEEKLQKRLNF